MTKLIKIEKLNNKRLLALFEKIEEKAKLLLNEDMNDNKLKFSQILNVMQELGFVKGMAMTLFDEPKNILKKIEELEKESD